MICTLEFLCLCTFMHCTVSKVINHIHTHLHRMFISEIINISMMFMPLILKRTPGPNWMCLVHHRSLAPAVYCCHYRMERVWCYMADTARSVWRKMWTGVKLTQTCSCSCRKVLWFCYFWVWIVFFTFMVTKLVTEMNSHSVIRILMSFSVFWWLYKMWRMRKRGGYRWT